MKFTSLKTAKDTMGGISLCCRLMTQKREGGESRGEAAEERFHVVPMDVQKLNMK